MHAIACLALITSIAAASHAQQALEQMKVADGFAVSLVAHEPDIRKPLSLTFDARGRLWVIQYLQYPTPAGLKPISVDQYLRTKYDRVPEPPPRGPEGADRITICEDFDDGGRPRKFKDFVSGLNLCSGLEIGYGGVFVVQPPYLLFYPDRNRDDAPDGDPEVLLTGFGMEDAHAVANSLTWGPDGWLYGAQGSTVTANIRGIEFQQGIWRYHPRTKEFEVFAEGGGNTWGLDFDEQGEILAGTNFEESKMLHQVQGGYYIKNFGKHGALHNPHAYGYFGHVPYSGYRGLHISSGGIIYQGGSYPAEFAGVYIFANVLDHAVYWANLRPQGSSFTASFGGALLKTSDEMFRPIDCTTGPDGAVYIADWCDKRASHVDPLDTWDRSKGRIFRVQSLNPRPLAQSPHSNTPGGGFDLERLSSLELVSLLSHPNDWYERQARRILAERRDPSVVPRLRSQIFAFSRSTARDEGKGLLSPALSSRGGEGGPTLPVNGTDTHLKDVAAHRKADIALRSLWALYVSGGFDDSLAARLLTHPDASVRAWTVRLLGDKRRVSARISRKLTVIARQDPSAIVRSQLACTAKRLPGNDALPILKELLRRDEDTKDPHIPLLVWWAIEDKAISSQSAVLKLFAAEDIWERPLSKQFIIERLAQRYAAEGNDFAACAELLKKAPDAGSERLVMAGMEKALTGQKFDKVPEPLAQWFAKAWASHSNEIAYVRFGLRLGSAPAFQAALRRVGDESCSQADRESLVEVLGQAGNPDCVTALLGIWEQPCSAKLRGAVLEALQHFPDSRIAEAYLQMYPQLSSGLRARARNALCSRAAWSVALLKAVDDGRIDLKVISLEQARQMAALRDPGLAQQIEKHWGKIQAASPQEKRNSINQLKLVLHPSGVVGRDAKGDRVEGKKVFQQTCGTCHKLFDEGNSVGPDLTAADRKNTDYLLEQIVNPSAYIRPEYVSYEVETTDEQAYSGLMVESTPAAVTLLDRNNERHLLPRAQIKELRESQVSLMPEGLLEALPPQSVMDLFAYLQGEHPLPPAAVPSDTEARN